MALDLISAIPAQPCLAVSQQPADEVDHLERNGDLRWKVEELLMVFDLVVYLLVVLGSEGSIADQHFVDYDSQGPPIHQLSVTDPL